MPVSRELLVNMSTPPPTPKRRRINWLAWAPVAVAVLGLVAAGVGYAVAGGPGPIRERLGLPEPPAPETFTVTGHVSLRLPNFAWATNPDVCTGRGLYDDITLGTPVVVTDENGTTIATGTLGVGYPIRNPSDATRAVQCDLEINTFSVPADRQFYRMKIGERQTIEYNKFDIRQKLDIRLD